nr:MAG TPA: hypothetical protein [Crassvirales sp.]
MFYSFISVHKVLSYHLPPLPFLPPDFFPPFPHAIIYFSLFFIFITAYFCIFKP